MTDQNAQKRPRTAKKAGNQRRMLTRARVRKLALDWENITSADASLGRQWDLPAMLAASVELHAAWRRGRLLRDLRRLASVGATRHEAAHDLGMALEDFEALVSADLEAAEIWNSGKLETAIRLKESLLVAAEAGKAQAIKQLENVLRSEIAHAQFNVCRVPEPLVEQIFGVTRQTLNAWHREKGLPRNAGETTYDLPAMLRWYEGFVRRRAGIVPPAEKGPTALEQQRLLDLEVRRGQLVDKGAVESGWAVRARALASILERIPDQYAAAAAGKTKQQLQPMFKSLCDDIRREYVTALDAETGKDDLT